MRGVASARRLNSPANGDAAVSVGLDDETGNGGNAVDCGVEQKSEGSMRRSDMVTQVRDDCVSNNALFLEP